MIFHSDKLSAALIKARTSRGYSQSYMARQLRISQKAYSYLETGKTKLAMTMLLRIADLTETHPMQFVEKISEGTPSWESESTKKEDIKMKNIENLDAQLTLLKSENTFLKATIEKILQKDLIK
jgi:transcriptional regulator with XRE-family HTH domain